MSDTVAVRELLEGKVFTPLEVSFWQGHDGPTMLDGQPGSVMFAFPYAVSQPVIDKVCASLAELSMLDSDAARNVATRNGVDVPPHPSAPVWDESWTGTWGQYRVAAEQFRNSQARWKSTEGGALLSTARRAVLRNAGAVECDVNVSGQGVVAVSLQCSCGPSPCVNVSPKEFSLVFSGELFSAPLGTDVASAVREAAQVEVDVCAEVLAKNRAAVDLAVRFNELYDRPQPEVKFSDDLTFLQWKETARARRQAQLLESAKFRTTVDAAVESEDFVALRSLLPLRYANRLQVATDVARQEKLHVFRTKFNMVTVSAHGQAQLVNLFAL